MAQKPKVTVVLNPDVMAAIERIAEKQKRPKSNLIAYIIEEWLEQNDVPNSTSNTD